MNSSLCHCASRAINQANSESEASVFGDSMRPMTDTPDQTGLPDSATAQLEALTQLLQQTLDETLLGLILHGSAATAGFDAERSDLDLLAIVQSPLTPTQYEALGKGIVQISNAPHPIEFSIVAKENLDSWSHPCRHLFHYGEDRREQFAGGVFEPTEPSDEDLAMHITLARARGIDLLGSYPVERLPEIPVRDYLRAILGDFEWARSQETDLGQYALANACRTMAYLDSGAILSKSEGIQWCRQNMASTADIVEKVISNLRRELGS